jgi:hypothetical protein
MRHCGYGRCGHFWSLNELTPRIFAIFGLGQIALGYFDNLDEARPVSCQNSIRKFIEDQKLKQESKLAYLGAGI